MREKKIIEKYDTEKFLVIVFRNRKEKEELLASLGLPKNERYIAASCLEIKRVADVEPVVGEGKSPPPHKAIFGYYLRRLQYRESNEGDRKDVS